MEIPSPTIFWANTGSGTRSKGIKGPDKGARRAILVLEGDVGMFFIEGTTDALFIVLFPLSHCSLIKFREQNENNYNNIFLRVNKAMP